MGTRWRGSGYCYELLLRKSFAVVTKNCSKMPLLLPGRVAVENRRAGTGEGISSDGEYTRRRKVCRLWHL